MVLPAVRGSWRITPLTCGYQSEGGIEDKQARLAPDNLDESLVGLPATGHVIVWLLGLPPARAAWVVHSAMIQPRAYSHALASPPSPEHCMACHCHRRP